MTAPRQTDERDRLLQDSLRRALHERQLRLAYQPIVSLGTGAVTALEALVRWQHPTRGLVSPAEFLPIAEESGMIVQIGEWVLHEACRESMRWSPSSGGPLPVNVNLSGAQIEAPGFPELVDDILADIGCPADRVRLEVSESSLLQPAGLEVLRTLRQRGLGVLLEDFGTGISTPEALAQMPIDGIKIDEGLISRLRATGAESDILHAGVVTARELELQIVAKGIETPQQAQLVRELGCGLAQGYHFAQPMAPALLDGFLGARVAARSRGRLSRTLRRRSPGAPGRQE
jgi:EAL domain-containing protein (putative c-di-GMP-specific phosphodiesterase class I)